MEAGFALAPTALGPNFCYDPRTRQAEGSAASKADRVSPRKAGRVYSQNGGWFALTALPRRAKIGAVRNHAGYGETEPLARCAVVMLAGVLDTEV